jgi:hypothetical protein
MEDEESASSYMILLDHSEYMRNDDYAPTRFEFQQDAACYLVDCILDEEEAKKSSMPPKIGVMAGTDVLVGPYEDIETVYEALGDNLALSTTDLTTSIRVASLALRKHEKENAMQQQQQQHQRKVIIVFVGSPLNNDDDNFAHVGRMLKNSRTEIVVITIGDETDNEKLKELVTIVSEKIVNLSPRYSGREALSGLVLGNNVLSAIDEERHHDAGDGDNDLQPKLLIAETVTSDADQSERIDQLLNRSKEERGKIEFMLQTSFSSDMIPSPPAMRNRNQRSTFGANGGAVNGAFGTPDQNNSEDAKEEGSDLSTPASSTTDGDTVVEEEQSSPLVAALDCGPEISMQLLPRTATTNTITTTRDEESRQKEELTSAMKDYENAVVQLERHMPMSPTSSYTDLRAEQENIARLANLNETHVSVAEYERVKTELRAAKRYIRVLQRLIHEKDEMISALHDMIGYLRQQVYGTDGGPAKSTPITNLTLDCMPQEARRNHSNSTSPSNRYPAKSEDHALLKTSSSGESNVSISEIRKKTRALEAMHAALTSKSNDLQKESTANAKPSFTVNGTSNILSITDKRNKKRELEALRASIAATS